GVNAIVMKKRRITEGQGYKGTCVSYNRETKKPEINILFDIARCPFVGKRGGLVGNINPAIANKVGRSSTIDLTKMYELFNGKIFYVDGVSKVKHMSDQGILAIKVDPAIALLTIHGYDTSIEDVGMVDLDNEAFYTHPHSSRCEDMILQYDLVYTAGIEKITIRYNNKQQNKKNKPKYVGSMVM
ncbi:MAG: hypothetical protein ACRC5T_11450, partial [Cetobacterium sp.]